MAAALFMDAPEAAKYAESYSPDPEDSDLW